jgi:Flp pilus assembly protein TadB
MRNVGFGNVTRSFITPRPVFNPSIRIENDMNPQNFHRLAIYSIAICVLCIVMLCVCLYMHMIFYAIMLAAFALLQAFNYCLMRNRQKEAERHHSRFGRRETKQQ